MDWLFLVHFRKPIFYVTQLLSVMASMSIHLVRWLCRKSFKSKCPCLSKFQKQCCWRKENFQMTAKLTPVSSWKGSKKWQFSIENFFRYRFLHTCWCNFERNSDFRFYLTAHCGFFRGVEMEKKVTRSICEFLNSKSEGGNVRVLLIYMRTRDKVF